MPRFCVHVAQQESKQRGRGVRRSSADRAVTEDGSERTGAPGFSSGKRASTEAPQSLLKSELGRVF